MEPEQIFSKPLTSTDVKSSLVIPIAWLEHFPQIPERYHSTNFTAIDLEGREWLFCLSTRRGDQHRKPVLNKGGWLAFARAKSLKEEDIIIFSRDGDEANGVTFRIRAFKTIRLMGEVIQKFV